MSESYRISTTAKKTVSGNAKDNVIIDGHELTTHIAQSFVNQQNYKIYLQYLPWTLQFTPMLS